MARVSVVMSVYNGKKFIREAIESVLSQTFEDFEFIIVDDCSNDGTLEIARSYTSDKRIKIITNERNMGLTRSLNAGIRYASARYIARMDGDDISLPERLERQVDFLDKNRDVGLLGSAACLIDEDGTILRIMPVTEDNEGIQRTLLRRNCFVHSSIMFRRDVFEEIGGYRDEFECAEDYDLILRISEHCKVHNLKDILCKYRLNKNGISFERLRCQENNARLACYLAQERRAGRDENLEANKKRIMGKGSGDISERTIIAGCLSRLHKLFSLSTRYYGIGCIYLYRGEMQAARGLFLCSLRYNPFNIKACICLVLTLLPFNTVRHLRFLFRGTAQYYREIEG